MAAPAPLPAAKPDLMDGVTESKPSRSFFTTGQRPQANWNRPVRSRTQGVWDPGANYSRGPDSASDLLDVVARSMKSCTNRTSSILMVSNLFSPHIKVI